MANSDRRPLALQAVDLCKSFPNPERNGHALKVIDGLSFSLREGEVLVVLGQSGCGKTTLLRILAGLTESDAGRLTIDSEEIVGPGYDRAIVFQDSNLLPWRTVLENIAFGLEMQGHPLSVIRKKVEYYLHLVGLEDYRNYYPHELSGGMQQRVGFARALAIEPRILLCDEPFGSLDAINREILQGELLSLLAKNRTAAVFVTHSVEEAVFLADRALVLPRSASDAIHELTIDLPKPRTIPDTKLTSEFAAYRRKLWELVTGGPEHVAS